MKVFKSKYFKAGLATLIIFVILVLLISQSISDYINNKWPPLTSEQQRTESIIRTKEIINSDNFLAEVMLAISHDDLIKIIKPIINQILINSQEFEVDGISDITIKEVSLDLIDQGIKIQIQTNFTIDKYSLSTSAKLSGDVAIIPYADNIYFKPAFSSIELSTKNRIKETWVMITNQNEIVLSTINSLINSFIVNLNRAVFEDGIKVPLNLNVAKNLKANEIGSDPDFIVSGDDINFNAKLSTMLYYINSSHVYFIGSSKKHTNSEIDNQKIQSDSSFNDLYEKFTTEVMDLLSHSFGQDFEAPEKNETVAIFSKAILADLFNKHLNQMNINVAAQGFYKVPDEGGPPGSNTFSNELLVDDKKAIPSCSGLRRKFKGDACNNPCKYGSCDKGCSWRKPHRCAAEALCKTDREISRANCQRKNTECKVKREAKRVALQGENELRVNKCRAKREAIKLLNGLIKLGDLYGEYWVNNSKMDIAIKSISVNDQLDQININTSLNASVDTKLRLKVNPDGLGHLACVFNFRKTLETTARFFNPDFKLQGNIGVISNNSDSLKLMATIRSSEINGKLIPSPYSQLMKDPSFSLNCTFLSMTMNAIAGVDLLSEGDLTEDFDTMFGRLNISIEPLNIPLTINPVMIGDNDVGLTLLPFIGQNVIGFSINTVNN